MKMIFCISSPKTKPTPKILSRKHFDDSTATSKECEPVLEESVVKKIKPVTGREIDPRRCHLTG